MDKIWYRNPLKSEVIGRCGGYEKTNDHTELTKVERLKNKNVDRSGGFSKWDFKFGLSSSVEYDDKYNGWQAPSFLTNHQEDKLGNIKQI